MAECPGTPDVKESDIKEGATCNTAPSTDLVVDDVKTEDVIAQIIEKRETRGQKFARTKQPKDVGALFQKYRDGGEKDAIVYLNQLTKTLKCNEPTLEPSGSYRASLECDGETFEGIGASKKLAKQSAATVAMSARCLSSGFPYTEHADSAQLGACASAADSTLDTSSVNSQLPLDSSSALRPAKKSKPRKKKVTSSGSAESVGETTTMEAEGSNVSQMSLPNAPPTTMTNPTCILNALAPCFYTPVSSEGQKDIEVAMTACSITTDSTTTTNGTSNERIGVVGEAVRGSDGAMPSTSSSSVETAPKKLKSSNSSTDLCVMSVRVNNEVFEGSALGKKKAKSAAAAAALLKLYNLRCTVGSDGTTYFAGDDAEWKCFLPKEKKKTVSIIRPVTFVAPVLQTHGARPKTPAAPAPANAQHPVSILSEICKDAKFESKRLVDTPLIYSVSVSIEGCQFEGCGATKADAKRAASEAALKSIEAIGLVVDRLRARRAKLLGLLPNPGGMMAGSYAANQRSSPRKTVTVSTDDFRYGYRRVGHPPTPFMMSTQNQGAGSNHAGFGGSGGAGRGSGIASLFKKKGGRGVGHAMGRSVSHQPAIKEEGGADFSGGAGYNNQGSYERGMDFTSFNGGARSSMSGGAIGGAEFDRRMSAEAQRCMGGPGGMRPQMTQQTYLNPGMDVGRSCSTTALIPSTSFSGTTMDRGGAYVGPPFITNRMVLGNSAGDESAFYNHTGGAAAGGNKFRGGIGYPY